MKYCYTYLCKKYYLKYTPIMKSEKQYTKLNQKIIKKKKKEADNLIIYLRVIFIVLLAD